MDQTQLLAEGDQRFWLKLSFIQAILGFCLHGTDEQNAVFSGQTSGKFIDALKRMREAHLEASKNIRQVFSQDNLAYLHAEFTALEAVIKSNDRDGIRREAQPLVGKALLWKQEKIDAEPVVKEKLASYLVILDWLDLLAAKAGIAYLELMRL